MKGEAASGRQQAPGHRRPYIWVYGADWCAAIHADINYLDYVWRIILGFGAIPCVLTIYLRCAPAAARIRTSSCFSQPWVACTCTRTRCRDDVATLHPHHLARTGSNLLSGLAGQNMPEASLSTADVERNDAKELYNIQLP